MLSNELLHWLFRVLQPEYSDPRTTYHDVAVLLQRYPTLKPRTRVYTYETGESALLLDIYGALPSRINGEVYRIPVEVWIPHEYPLASPIAYVTPTEKMVLQPGNHVDTNGKCYLEYTANWSAERRSNVAGLCDDLCLVFAKEPPVFAKPTQPIVQPVVKPVVQPVVQQGALHRPDQRPPSLPSKELIIAPEPVHAQGVVNSPPPLPPLPHELRSQIVKSPTLNQMTRQSHLKPAFEQPNILDALADDQQGEGNGTDRSEVLSKIESQLQSLYNMEIATEVNSLHSNVAEIQYAVGKFDKIFTYEFDTVEKIQQHLEQNERLLAKCIKDADVAIEKANSIREIDTAEMICAENVVYNQLYDLVAEDQAIGDTIYVLTKAYDNGNVPLPSFIKHTRSLAREQFFKKAMIVKISQMLNLNK